jgi:hypothetical protein
MNKYLISVVLLVASMGAMATDWAYNGDGGIYMAGIDSVDKPGLGLAFTPEMACHPILVVSGQHKVVSIIVGESSYRIKGLKSVDTDDGVYSMLKLEGSSDTADMLADLMHESSATVIFDKKSYDYSLKKSEVAIAQALKACFAVAIPEE